MIQASDADAIPAALCNLGLTEIDRLNLDDPTEKAAIEALYRANAGLNRDLRALVAPEPPPAKVILHERFRTGLGVYRTVDELTWGQGTKEKPARAGTYRPDHVHCDEGLHFDVRPDRQGLKNPAGRSTFECGYVQTQVPCFVDITTVCRWLTAKGIWYGATWLAYNGPGGWSVMEIDGPEDYGAPKGDWHHARYSLATHMGFDGMSSPPYSNAQANLLKQNHWHESPRDTHMHAHGLRIEPDDEKHLKIIWSLDGDVTQTLFTGDFEKLVPPRTLDAALAKVRVGGFNLRHMTQITGNPGWHPEAGLVLPSALLIDEVLVKSSI